MNMLRVELVLEHSIAVLTSKSCSRDAGRVGGQQVSLVTTARLARTSRKQSGTKIEEASCDMMEVSACTLAGISWRAGLFVHDGRAAA